ncbi:MAG: MgtC/SapB family protein [Erysipelotrichaceae bacterium]|jgi:putative Mg2+ transporter-C (MgtC) family protein|nr:MgtC/SapB family protein [Erysipelotrichaceae bacterium]
MFIQSLEDPIAVLLGGWAGELNAGAILLRIGLAFLLGAITGCERASNRHIAGLRTFILVSTASASAMLADLSLMQAGVLSFPAISAATVLGIANISTYSISYSSKNQIKGLTTAVAVWSTSIIGLTIGAGLYTAGLVGYAAMILCLSCLNPMEAWLKDRSNHFEIHLELSERSGLQDFTATLRKLGVRVDDIESNPAYLNSGISVYTISLTVLDKELKKDRNHKNTIDALQSLDYVRYIEEIR